MAAFAKGQGVQQFCANYLGKIIAAKNAYEDLIIDLEERCGLPYGFPPRFEDVPNLLAEIEQASNFRRSFHSSVIEALQKHDRNTRNRRKGAARTGHRAILRVLQASSFGEPCLRLESCSMALKRIKAGVTRGTDSRAESNSGSSSTKEHSDALGPCMLCFKSGVELQCGHTFCCGCIQRMLRNGAATCSQCVTE
jgi:hypothetical protein